MYKKSFTLFEVIISFIILSLVLISVGKLFVDDNSIEVYYELQKIQNDYIQNSTVTQTQNIKLNSY